MVDILTEGGGLLSDRHYSIIIDNSPMMAGDMDGHNLWLTIENATLAIANKCEEYDFDGLTFYFSSCPQAKFEGVNASEIAHLFESNPPSPQAKLEPAFKAAIEDYFSRRPLGVAGKQRETLIVILGAMANSPAKIEQAVVGAANQISQDEELAILFVQVGQDRQLTDLLQKWDENLLELGAKFAICDAITIQQIKPDILAELLLNAIAA